MIRLSFRIVCFLAAPIVFFACAAISPAQNYPPPFPREAARMLFENDRVAVWDVTWPKGQPSALHEHPVDQISVTLVGGKVRVTRLGGTPSISESAPGKVVFTPKGTVHMEEGMSDVPQRKIMLQLKSSGTPARRVSDVPAAFLREGAVKVFENARATAWDFTWKPGSRTPQPVNNLDSVIVFLAGGTIRSVVEGRSVDAVRKTGDVVYLAREGAPTMEEAVASVPRAIVVDLK